MGYLNNSLSSEDMDTIYPADDWSSGLPVRAASDSSEQGDQTPCTEVDLPGYEFTIQLQEEIL